MGKLVEVAEPFKGVTRKEAHVEHAGRDARSVRKLSERKRGQRRELRRLDLACVEASQWCRLCGGKSMV
jgi:hypothetical protein